VDHVVLAACLGTIALRIGAAHAPEDLAPALAVMQPKGGAERVTCFVAEQSHAFAVSLSLDLEHHATLHPDESRMGEIEGDRDSGYAIRTEPVVGEPGMWPQSQAPVSELVVETIDEGPEVGVLDP